MIGLDTNVLVAHAILDFTLNPQDFEIFGGFVIHTVTASG